MTGNKFPYFVDHELRPSKFHRLTTVELYEALGWPRLIEEDADLLRQNESANGLVVIGQEAISVGVTQALEPDEYILPMHRNPFVFTGRQLPFQQTLFSMAGYRSGYTKGRDRSFHFGTREHHIVGMISHLGPQNGVANGIALVSLLRQQKKVTAVFNGDGGTSEGDFHEAINVAAVWDLPVILSSRTMDTGCRPESGTIPVQTVYRQSDWLW